MKKTITSDLIKARKNKDQVTANVLRQVLGEITTLEKSLKYKGETTTEDIFIIVRKLIKQRNEAVKLYLQGGNIEQAHLEQAEQRILNFYLPEKITGIVLADLVDYVIRELGITSIKDMGKVMKACKGAGEIDGKELSTIVRDLLK